jgi:hypothetical protein
MKTRETYWREQEKVRTLTGQLPENAFNFISIHPHIDKNKKEYTLISPLCLCNKNGIIRPEFERDRYKTVKQAHSAARMISALSEKEINLPIEVVFCPG